MELDEKQKTEVAKWFAAGTGLDEIQKRIASEFGIKISYLDLRLMVAELPQPEEKPAEPEKPEEHGREQFPDDPGYQDAPDYPDDAGRPEAPDAAEDQMPPEDQNAAGGDVSVDMDALTIPGTIASGTATFSDGTSGKWYLDQMGRLGMAELPAGYRPSQGDATMFQTKLVELLRSKGLM